MSEHRDKEIAEFEALFASRDSIGDYVRAESSEMIDDLLNLMKVRDALQEVDDHFPAFAVIKIETPTSTSGQHVEIEMELDVEPDLFMPEDFTHNRVTDGDILDEFAFNDLRMRIRVLDNDEGTIGYMEIEDEELIGFDDEGHGLTNFPTLQDNADPTIAPYAMLASELREAMGKYNQRGSNYDIGDSIRFIAHHAHETMYSFPIKVSKVKDSRAEPATYHGLQVSYYREDVVRQAIHGQQSSLKMRLVDEENGDDFMICETLDDHRIAILRRDLSDPSPYYPITEGEGSFTQANLHKLAATIETSLARYPDSMRQNELDDDLLEIIEEMRDMHPMKPFISVNTAMDQDGNSIKVTYSEEAFTRTGEDIGDEFVEFAVVDEFDTPLGSIVFEHGGIRVNSADGIIRAPEFSEDRANENKLSLMMQRIAMAENPLQAIAESRSELFDVGREVLQSEDAQIEERQAVTIINGHEAVSYTSRHDYRDDGTPTRRDDVRISNKLTDERLLISIVDDEIQIAFKNASMERAVQVREPFDEDLYVEVIQNLAQLQMYIAQHESRQAGTG